MSEVINVVSPVAVAVFPHLEAHEEYMGTSTGKYSLTLEFNPDDVKPIQEAIAKAGGGKGTDPLKKVADDAEYSAGMYRLKAKSKFPVKVIDTSKLAVDPSTITNGAKVRAKLGFAPYQTGANAGVTVYLNAIQLLEAGGSANDLDFGELPEGFDLPF